MERMISEDLRNKLDPKQLESMRNVFAVFDDDGDGQVNKNEIASKLMKLNLVTSRKMINAIMEVVDEDGDGEMDFNEFVELLGRVKGDHSADDSAIELDADAAAEERKKISQEEKDKAALRQQALAAFQRAVTVLSFEQMAGDKEGLREEVLLVLNKLPNERTEWELQRLLMWAETFEFIQKMPPSSESDVRIEVCRFLTVNRAKTGTVLCRQGEKGDTMWIVMHGDIQVQEDGPGGVVNQLAEIGEGKSFGELAVMGDESERQRIATCVAKTDCVLGVLHRDIYRRLILKMHEEAKADVVERLLKVRAHTYYGCSAHPQSMPARPA